MVEQLPFKEKVEGSNPSGRTTEPSLRKGGLILKMKKLDKKLDNFLEENFEEACSFLQKLVQTNSSNPSTPENSQPDDPIELGVAQKINEKLSKIGFNPSFKGVSKERPNVVCEIGNSKGPSLILNGHMDTVIPSENYSFDPFSGRIKDGKLYGVGSADMKASLVSFIYVAKAIKSLGLDLNGKLTLTFVVDEEPGGCSDYGTKFLLKNGLSGDGAIVAEPGINKIAIGHRGGYRFKMTTFGESVHTGISDWEKKKRGENAIEAMAEAIEALRGLEIDFNPSSTFPGNKPVFTFPTKIKGGSAINIVPEKCEAYGDVRLLPGSNGGDVRKKMENKLDKKNIKYKIEDITSVPAIETSPKKRIVKTLSKNYREVVDKKPVKKGCGPWNDGWMFHERNIPVICGFGPSGENIHSADEFVYLDSFKKATKIYLKTVIDYLEAS